MQIQSLSVVVPNSKCINCCPFCVSRMVSEYGFDYENLMDINHPHYDINVQEYMKRLRYVADNGCHTMMLTGTTEPQQNKQFLATLGLLHRLIGSPFRNIEMQTTGFGLDKDRDYIRFLRNYVGVNTIAISVNGMSDEQNCRIIGHLGEDGEPEFKLDDFCKLLKDYGYNIRVCINLTDAFNGHSGNEICSWAVGGLGADQITFRKLYSSSRDTPQGKWIENHSIAIETRSNIEEYLSHRTVLGKTPYGATIYEGWNCSIVYDTDCMGKNPLTDTHKYLILRQNCRLYAQWDTPASLVF